MRTLHKFIVKSFIGPFFLTFCISLFILLMQFLWKYIDDLVGKGLEWYIIAELLAYASASLVPMALPLAMLLSSIMTFGNFGENYELVAMKSAGISLKRIMFPLIIVTFFISLSAFYFSNNVLPVANLKFGSLLYDITHKKPAIDIKEGIFYNGIDNYSIRITRKENNGTLLKGLIIYDHTQRLGNTKVIIAESGTMEITSNKEFLILKLKNGHSYEEQRSQGRNSKSDNFMRVSFKEETVMIRLSDFNLTRTDEELFKDNYAMLNLGQLNKAVGELREDNALKQTEFEKNFGINFHVKRKENDSLQEPVKMDSLVPLNLDSLLNKLTKSQRIQVIDAAQNMARNAKSQIESHVEILKSRKKYVNKHLVEWHRKFTLSFACMILFFIGAPLGAIIRKGGLGMPLVVSVVLFIIFHVLSISGEKMVKEGVVGAVYGMWMASAILLPVGIYLTLQASREASLFDINTYKEFVKKITRQSK